MDKDELRQLLQQPYQPENWNKVISFVFPNVSFLQSPRPIPHSNPIVDSFKQTGTVRLNDGKNLAVFEVRVAENVMIPRNRVALRNLVAPFIDQERNHGVLVVYEQGKEDYRFTFTAKDTEFDEDASDFVKHETDSKRFTYILGANETCRTARDRFWELSTKKGTATLKDVEEAFSVERLNKEFFPEYKKHYKAFTDYLTASTFKVSAFNSEEKRIRDFVKVMLGRIVFLHFVQKKDWLGASDTNFMDGDKDFLIHFWQQSGKDENFYNIHLSKLFFEALDRNERENETFILPDGREICIPFLGGGLFEKDRNEPNLLTFPPELFDNLFNFFAEYNFTIDENDPYENEVGIDPEMLGHVFENLLEDYKDKGAFYTPKVIVKYMCQESLIQYLLTKLEENGVFKVKGKDKTWFEGQVGNFVRRYEAGELIEYDEILSWALHTIKVCDPAIGSGAFPMGILNEMVMLINVLHNASPDVVEEIWQMEDWQPATVKKHIIQNSIYGVDIEKGAVDIAKLRFWLSLIVDEEHPRSLPNLDYKIMQGDSLLESFEGIDLSKSALFEPPKVRLFTPDMFKEPESNYALSDENKNDIKELLNRFYNTGIKSIKIEIQKQIDKIVTNHIDKALEGYENRLLIEIEGLEETLSRKHEFQRNQNNTIKEIEKRKKLFAQKSDARKRLLDLEHTEERPYFLWHLYFINVFEEGGFDLVIGNPPYIQLQKMGNVADKLQQAGYKTFRRTGDIYTLFYEKGVDILKDKGTLTYITSNTWMRTNFGEGLREFFVKKSNPEILLNFEDTKIFPTATVEVNIMVTKKDKWNNNLQAVAIKGDYIPGYPINDYLNSRKIVLYDLDKESWVIVDNEDFEIKKHLSEKGIQLKKWDIDFYRGFLTGFNDAFFIDSVKKQELISNDSKCAEIIKPLLRGREIKKYGYNFSDNYVIFPHNGVKEDKKQKIKGIKRIDVEKEYPIIYNHLLQYKDRNSPLVKKDANGNIQTLIDRADQGDHWTNLRNCAYLNVFDIDKIVWLSISDKPAFALDTNKMYVTAPAYIMVSKCNKYLLTMLNSKVMEWYLDKVSSSTGQGTNQWSKIFVEQLPIPQLSEENRKPFEILADYLILLNDPNTSNIIEPSSNEMISQQLEEVVNMMIYELYFEEHMKEKEIDVLQFVNFPDISNMQTFEEKRDTIQKIYNWLKEKDNPIRNRILVSESRSWIIKRINQSTH